MITEKDEVLRVIFGSPNSRLVIARFYGYYQCDKLFFPRWLQQDFPSHMLFLQSDIVTSLIEKWGLCSHRLNIGGPVTTKEEKLYNF